MQLFHENSGPKIIVTTLILLVQSVCGFYENQPKFISEDGHLIVESALNRNITFRMKGRGYVNVNDVNILNALLATSNSVDLSGMNQENSLRRFSSRLRSLESRINSREGLMQRLERFENSTNTNDGIRNSNLIRQIDVRVQRLEERVEIIIRKLTEDNCRSFPCQNGGTCVSRYEGFICQCVSNWDGPTCGQDVNECARFAGTDLGCQNGATCVNTQGSYNCLCRSGWQGLHCTRNTADCLSGNSGDLCGHGTCVQTNNAVGYTCICEQGWTTNGVIPACTVDVNECLDSKPHCSKDPEVACVNLPGSFMCGFCPQGFTGNGYYCSDINECETNNGDCSTAPSVPCINTRGSYRCGSCPSGYEGDGKSCIRTGTTCSRSDFCHPQARCVEYTNSVVSCVCPDGYTGNGFGPNGCIRNDGCTPNPCLNGGTCVRNGFDWVCNCPPQTLAPNCASRANLCSPNPCLNGGTCIQTLNQRRCSCANGYLGINCQTEPRACGGRLSAPTGILKYPLEGAPTYQHNARCAWLIQTNITQILNITFTQFNLENSRDCRYDWLQIHDGRSSASYMIGRFCGTALPNGGNILSTHNLLYLWFRSDNSTSHGGFTLNWKTVDPICGGEFDTSTFGTISSPGSPGNYPPNRDCVWHVSAPAGKRLQLHFYTMKLEVHNTCDKDYLTIHSGSTVEGPLLEKFCNTSQPEPILTPSNEVTLYFHSDGDSTDTGFQIHYSVVEGIPGCGGTFTSLRGEFGSPMENGQYQHNLVCEYIIKMPIDVRINIEFRQFHIEEHSECRFDYVAIYEGKTDQEPLVNKYCGTVVPPSYTSESNILMIKFKSDWSTAHSGFRISYTNVCGGSLSEEFGIFTSPNYPQPYDADHVCQYVIEAPIGKGIILDFMDFDLESTTTSDCSYDYIQVYDGIRSNSSIGKYCGDQIPDRVVSTYNYLYIELVTDSSISGRGFKANYSFFDSHCGGILKSADIVIRPPVHESYDDQYAHDSYCKWLIVAPAGKAIQLTWITFDIESAPGCSYDYIEIYDNSTNFGGQIGKYCGRIHPPTFTSSDNMITIIFKSDLTRNAGGFSATFVFIDASKSCGGRYYSVTGVLRSPGFPDSYMHSKTCEWVISVPTGQQIELVPKTFELESHRDCRFDYLEIRNGGNSMSPLYGKFCGNTIPDHLTSFSNQIYLKFVSDHSQSHKGFEIEWDGTSTGCGGVLTSHRGLITSPNYPDPYGENTICVWRISVNLGSNIQIIISDLEMESTSSCSFDYLEIFDGRDASSHSLGKFCTDNHPLHIESTGNHMYLRMQTDGSDQGRGFTLRYNTICKKEITGHMGVIESLNFPGNYPPMLECEWTIRATTGNKIFMEFSHFDIENSNIFDGGDHTCSFDYVEIRQLEDSREISSRKYCNHAPTNFTSQFDVVIVKFVTDNSGTETGFRLEWKIEGCGDIMTRPFGIFSSPNYPKAYPKNTHCEWTIIADYGFSVQLTINDFAMESSDNCHFDGLFISNGRNDTQILATLCHVNSQPTIITGHGNEMFVKFYSDISVTGKGFSASYRFVESNCGGILSIPTGFIYSPNYPKNYDVNSICEWLIKIEKNHLIELYVMDFDIESSPDCRHDKLKIYDGSEANEEKLLMTHCGNQLPNATKYLSTDNEMLIVFNTDDSIAAKGFKLNYTVACGARIVTNDTGMLSLTESLKHHFTNCTWIIEASKPSQHVTLTITHLDILREEDQSAESTERCIKALEIYDGDTLTSPKKGVFCGIKTPTPIISSGQYLTVNLVTNDPYGSGLTGVHFTAHYSIYDNACGGTFTSEHGTFASPHYPNSYPFNAECIWNITASPGNRIGISLQSLDITYSDNCHDSYLEIREINEGGNLVGIYCRPNPAINLTSANGFWVKFRSGELGTAKGFIADYFYDVHAEIAGLSGSIASPLYPYNLMGRDKKYTWRVTVEFGSIISVTFKEFSLDGTSYCNSQFKIYDGYDENAPALTEELCGSDIPDPLTSSSNVLYFELEQSRSFSGSRFLLNWIRIDKSILKKNETDSICGNRTIILTELDKIVNFTSPGYPYGYAPNINCSWIIMSNHTTYHPVITMHDIDLEPMDNCVADYIEIFASNDLSTWKQLTKICSYSTEKDNTFHGIPYLRIDFRSDYSANKTGYRGSLMLVCGSALKSSTGVIIMKSNDEISNRLAIPGNTCMWNITVRPGRTIKFTFETFVLPMTSENRCASSIVLRNGIDEESPFLGLGKYCGTTISEINQTTGNRAFVKYKYGSDRRSEFILRYQEISQECGGNVFLTKNVNSTIITSPNYPNVPYSHSECVWIVMAPSGENLKFEFLETFDLRYSRECLLEYIEIRDGSTNSARFIGKYCGTKPEPRTTNNNIIRLKFFTDVFEPNNGFKIKVSIAACGAVYRSYKGIVSSPNFPSIGAYPPNSNCEYHIVGKPGTYLNITFTSLDLPEGNCSNSDYVQIFSVVPGESRNITENILGTFCGSVPPPSLLSEGNEVKIIFKTFKLQARRGFQIAYNSSVQECGAELNTESGIITSPGYPNAKQIKRFCIWTIQVPKGRRIRIDFDDFDLIPSPTTYKQRLGFFNEHRYLNKIMFLKGGDAVQPIYSSDNKLMINMWVRVPSNHRGFKLRYSSNESTICEGNLNQVEGTIISPSNVSTYVCQYVRIPTPFFDQDNVGTIAVEFSDMIIGNSTLSICTYASTKISVYFVEDFNILSSFCGNGTRTATVRSPFVNTIIEARQGPNYGNVSFTITYKTHKCGGLIHSQLQEIIKHPNFTESYGKVDCAWQIKYNEGPVVNVQFRALSLKLACNKEFITIYNGPSPKSPKIGTYCETTLPETLNAHSHTVFIEYHSDSYSRESNFELITTPSLTTCGGIFSRPNFNLRSPITNSQYPNDIECIWELRALPGYHIGLYFTGRFFLEQSVNCSKDYIEIFEQDKTGWKTLSRICGRQIPPIVNSTGTIMKVIFRSDNSITGDGFNATWQENCGGTFDATTAVQLISSPGYPDQYGKSMYCNYTILALKDEFISIQFLDFELENRLNDCVYDNVTIYKVREYVSVHEMEIVGTYCQNKPENIRAKNQVNIVFKTDKWVERKGFQFQYSVDKCGGIVTESSVIESPILSGTDVYPTHLTCYWNITAPLGKKITIRFEKLHLEHNEHCYYDYLEIFTGTEVSEDKRLAKLCGNLTIHPPTINVDSNHAVVHLRTDSSNNFGGFSALIIFSEMCNKKIDLTIATPNYDLNEIHASYSPLLDCHYIVTAPLDRLIEVSFEQFHLAACDVNHNKSGCVCDFIEIRDGEGPFGDLIGKYCDQNIPKAVASSGPTLWIRFTTDATISSTGFIASLNLHDSVCGSHIITMTEEHTKIIQSPGDDKYLPNLRCVWVLTAGYNEQIEIDFEKLDLQAVGDYGLCSNDMLEISDDTVRPFVSEGLGQDLIYSGKGESSSSSFYSGIRSAITHNQYCGNGTPQAFISSSNKVHIKFQTDSDIELTGFKLIARVIKNCGRNYTSTQGRIVTRDAEDCAFWITAPENFTISLYFISVVFSETNCDVNGLKIYENGPEGALIGSFCGYIVPDPVFATTRSLYIRVQKSGGFHGSYDFSYLASNQGSGCGGQLFNYGGLFSSPQYPRNDRNFSDCRWDISVPQNLKVTLRFSVFDLGSEKTCGSNFVEIIEIDKNTEVQTIARTYCGEEVPATYRGNRNVLSVRFKKTVNFSGTGFLAQFIGVHTSTEVHDW